MYTRQSYIKYIYWNCDIHPFLVLMDNNWKTVYLSWVKYSYPQRLLFLSIELQMVVVSMTYVLYDMQSCYKGALKTCLFCIDQQRATNMMDKKSKGMYHENKQYQGYKGICTSNASRITTSIRRSPLRLESRIPTETKYH